MPYGWPYAVLVLLQAAVIPLVRDPSLLPRIPRHPLLGLLPLITIGGGVIVLGAVPGAVAAVTTLAAFAVPPLALLAVLHVRRWAVPLAIVSPLLWLLAWRLPESGWTELAGDLLIVLAGVSLGRLTGWIAPRAALVVGVLVVRAVRLWRRTEGGKGAPIAGRDMAWEVRPGSLEIFTRGDESKVSAVKRFPADRLRNVVAHAAPEVPLAPGERPPGRRLCAPGRHPHAGHARL